MVEEETTTMAAATTTGADTVMVTVAGKEMAMETTMVRVKQEIFWRVYHGEIK